MRVSTLIFSPVVMNSGTWIWTPVCSVAGLVPPVDRNILRIGAYELLWQDQVPDAVAISEAVQLARDLSTEGSPAFVNGLLARLLELKPTLAL